MIKFFASMMLIGMLSLTGCFRGGFSSVRDPGDIRLFVQVLDYDSQKPLEGVNIYYRFKYPKLYRPIPLWMDAAQKDGVVATDEFGYGFIELDDVVSVDLLEAVFPGYLWIREGAEYDETFNRWINGRGAPLYLPRGGLFSQEKPGMSPGNPYVFFMQKGAVGRYSGYWRRLDASGKSLGSDLD